MSISIIVAQAENGVIGLADKIPWRLPADLKRFKTLTLNHPVVMGRKTYDSIIARLGHPLPDRENIVLTRRHNFIAPGCRVVNDWTEIQTLGRKTNVFVIGGAEIYQLALSDAKTIYLTLVKTKIAGDAHFPLFNLAEWNLVSTEKHAADEKNEYDFEFKIYERKK